MTSAKENEDTIEFMAKKFSHPNELLSHYQNLPDDPLVSGTDYSAHFRLEGYFFDRETFLKWARNVGKKKNMVLVIHTSWMSRSCRAIGLCCDKFGESKSAKKTKKIGCKFELEGREEMPNRWFVRVKCGVHNHDLSQTLQGSETVKRLSSTQNAKLRIDSGLGKPKENEPATSKRLLSSSPGRGSCVRGGERSGNNSPDNISLSGAGAEGDEKEEEYQPVYHQNLNWGPWGSKKVDDFMISYAEKTCEVFRDGHCGYRAISVLLGYGEQDYIRVRREIVCELSTNKGIYEKVNNEIPINELINNVNYTSFENCPTESEIKMPIIGLAVATRYKVALVCLDSGKAYTCLPMIATSPDDKPPTRIFTIALVGHREHYVPVWLCPNALIPPPPKEWTQYHHSSVDGWKEPYKKRMDLFCCDYCLRRGFS